MSDPSEDTDEFFDAPGQNIFDQQEEDHGPDDSTQGLDDEPDDCTGDLSDVEGEPRNPIGLSQTRSRRVHLVQEGADIADHVRQVLKFMAQPEINLDLPILLDAISWGDSGCHSDRVVQATRTQLMVSDELPGILQRWYRPPRSGTAKGKGKRLARGRVPLLAFAHTSIADAVDCEIKETTFLFLSPPEDLSEEHLTSLDLLLK